MRFHLHDVFYNCGVGENFVHGNGYSREYFLELDIRIRSETYNKREVKLWFTQQYKSVCFRASFVMISRLFHSHVIGIAVLYSFQQEVLSDFFSEKQNVFSDPPQPRRARISTDTLFSTGVLRNTSAPWKTTSFSARNWLREYLSAITSLKRFNVLWDS